MSREPIAPDFEPESYAQAVRRQRMDKLRSELTQRGVRTEHLRPEDLRLLVAATRLGDELAKADRTLVAEIPDRPGGPRFTLPSSIFAQALAITTCVALLTALWLIGSAMTGDL